MRKLHAAPFLLLILAGAAQAQQAYKPTSAEIREAYGRANDLQRFADGATSNLTLTVGWIGNGDHLWYRSDKPGGKKEFIKVDCLKKSRSPLFDHEAMAKALTGTLGREVKADALPFQSVTVEIGTDLIVVPVEGSTYTFDPKTGKLEKGGTFQREAVFETRLEEEASPEYPAPYLKEYNPPLYQEGRVRVREGQIEMRAGDNWTAITKQGNYARADLAPVGGKILAFRLLPGDRRLVYLLKSSVLGTTRAALEQRLYDQPGDKLDEFEAWVIDPQSKTETKLDMAPIMGGGQPWANPPALRWKDSRAFFDFPVRGYQEHKVAMVDTATATVKTIVDEKSPTFIDQSKTTFLLVRDGKQVIWQSERDGWCHLYMVDVATGEAKQITKGPWVVRGITAIDEGKSQIFFTASGFGDNAKEDPYHIHACKVNFDGSGFTRLTDGDGTHSVTYSGDRRFLVDSWSRVDQPPVHELRDGLTGKLILTLEKSDIGQLKKNGMKLPERFVAKARDGKSDIWGIIVRPTDFDPEKKYPVIEYIYAGPHDSFVPKGFRPFFNMHRLAELGFIVVQIDGMGTNNRGKAFHDVCWKNVADAGFPDRILWMQALAKKYPQADIERVGIYGTSAGGQSSTGGILNHGDFYKVAVSSCGCHDNRIDKQWWNEQWMGYPVGPHYDKQSNITNAGKLKGRLMLIVGEQDRNVPPETTFRLADSLIRARKEFELVVIPGADHTDGGPYGERKRRDFFVKWLLGVEPPGWNEDGS